MHVCVFLHSLKHSHKHTVSLVYTYKRAQPHHAHTQAHTCAHKRTHMRTHTHTHKHTLTE